MMLNDERAVVPIGSFHKRFGVTLPLPSTVGGNGVLDVFEPALSDEDCVGLQKSAQNLKSALDGVLKR